MKKHVSKVDDLSQVKALLLIDRFCQFTTVATLQKEGFHVPNVKGN
jgi:hypothetical protein